MSVSGMFLTAKVGAGAGVELEDNNSWKVAVSAKDLDRTTGADAGYGNSDPGVKRATVTIHGFLDLATVTGGAYADLETGTVLTNLALYYQRGDGTPGWVFPLAVVMDSDLGGEVDGMFEWNCTVKSKGVWTYQPPA